MGRRELPGSLDSAAECEAVLTWMSVLLGVLLPILLVVKTEPAASFMLWQARRRQASSAASSGGGKPVAHALHGAELAVESGVRALCGPSWLAPSHRRDAHDGRLSPDMPGIQRAVHCVLLLMVVWGASVLAVN